APARWFRGARRRACRSGNSRSPHPTAWPRCRARSPPTAGSTPATASGKLVGTFSSALPRAMTERAHARPWLSSGTSGPRISPTFAPLSSRPGLALRSPRGQFPQQLVCPRNPRPRGRPDALSAAQLVPSRGGPRPAPGDLRARLRSRGTVAPDPTQVVHVHHGAPPDDRPPAPRTGGLDRGRG